MNICIKNNIKNFKEVNYLELFESVKKSNYKHNLENMKFSDTIFNFKRYLKPNLNEIQYANLDQLPNLNEDIERTRRIYKRIQEFIPKKILHIQSEKITLDKQSFRLTIQQYKKSNSLIMDKLKKCKNQSKEYNIEIKHRIRYVYKIYSYIIPSLYIIKRPSYNVVQCKWKFMGLVQKQIHLGTFKKVGSLNEEMLKNISIKKINEKYNGFFDNLLLKNILLEKKKLTKWCNDINYRSKK